MTDRIKEIVKTFFKTQAALAEYLNITKQQASRYVTGDSKPTVDTIYKLYKDYNINPTWLICGIGDMLLSDTEKVNTSQHIQELNNKIKELEIENKVLKELIKK